MKLPEPIKKQQPGVSTTIGQPRKKVLSTSQSTYVNEAAVGKASNNAYQIMLEQGHFKHDTSLETLFKVHRELAKQIYDNDRALLQEIKDRG